MTNKRWLLCVFSLLLLMLFFASALGETARVVTPKGPLNMRKTADEKGKVVDSVPNKSLVTVDEVGEEWTKITYKKKSGYVKTVYLKLPRDMVGKELYADEGPLLLRVSENENAAVAYPVDAWQAVKVESVSGDWARVSCNGVSGYVETKLLSYQLEEPSGAMNWLEEAAVAVQPIELRASADPTSEIIASLQPGDEAVVTMIEKDQCLLYTAENGCGYAPVSAVALQGEKFDDGQEAGTLTPNEAIAKGEAALKKKFKAFAKEKLYSITAVMAEGREFDTPHYACGFFNDQDQYLFLALVNAETGAVDFQANYADFGVISQEAALLPEGEVQVALSAETVGVGEVVDIAVSAWTLHQAQYTLYFNDSQAVKSEPGKHFAAAYRPREAGSYRLEVTVTDEKGKAVTAEAAFTVDGSLTPNDGIQEIYSQKDGWWKSKKYRHSSLAKSGCAIFTLAHALERMGETGDAILPENLATKYSYCLIPEEGTNNTLLINTAARDFGFTTESKLINDQGRIADLIHDGALFSFSIARGHIAMVSGISEDGSMIRVVDSAPLATFERIKDSAQYYEKRPGVYRAALNLDDLPGARWFFETDEYGGMEYWLTMDYVAKRGVRLIQPGEAE